MKAGGSVASVLGLVGWLLMGSPGLIFSGMGAEARDFGVDVSHYQGATGISQTAWNSMYSQGRRFAFIKATEGLSGPDDAAMSANVQRATAAGLLAGVYHYCHPENRPTPAGAIQEADHFLAYAGSAIGPGKLRPVLDLEGSSAGLTTAALTDWVMAFHDEIVAQRGAGAAPIIYMNRSFASSEVDNRLANYDLWLAYPTDVDVSTSAPPPTASYPIPTGVFRNWCFWQYSWTGNYGGISPLDLDVCHSEYKTLEELLIPTPLPTALSVTSISAGVFEIGFTNVAGTHFSVLRTSEVTLPLAQWTRLGAATENAPGQFRFRDNAAPAGAAFYRVVSP